ncbi:MAG TPA: type II toxin-antitoxin system RelE/ParE family toxin [Candidatus Tectomicrobia bacterium]
MTWDVEYTDAFRAWWDTLIESQQDDVAVAVQLLMDAGPQLRFPHSSGVEGSRHSHMRELRVQSGGRPLRIFYVFDPRRTALLLIGGDKTGDDRFYDTYIPIADRLYEAYLDELRREGHLT